MTDTAFGAVMSRLSALDTLSLRVSQDWLAFGLDRVDVLVIDVLTISELTAAELVRRHRLVEQDPQPGRELGLTRVWTGWLGEASDVAPVTMRLTVAAGDG
ncbi:hypothetical protein ACFQHV_10050 [Promicromonospora thailandica]|uniref:Uncharacterized protein n=1 Tax=Promicromonospora thailandica TaxID=765201 RepID=A0A9X2G7V2_9MICO|nr:hypothetical protein [Promicromonospora thailandica]MCP2264819.1 hypothetical protein [Promicromonospora thailandica]BFF18929.1 hypothetical protein GCM10025730_24500 [Promicromonospora thailandica]